MKLQHKMLMFLVPSIVVPLVAVGWIAYTQLRNSVEQNYLREMTDALQQVDGRLQARIQQTAANTALFATSFLVEKYALTTDEEQRYSLLQRPLLRLFANYQDAFPDYHELRFILPDGFEAARRVTWDMGNVTEDEAGSPLLAALDARQEGVHTEIAVNPNTGKLAIYAGKALRLRDTSVDPLVAPLVLRGYLVVTSSLDPIRELIRGYRFGKDGRLVMADSTGKLHVHHQNVHDRLLPDHAPDAFHFAAQDIAALISTVGNPHRLVLSARAEAVYAAGAELQPGLYLFAMLPDGEVAQAVADLRNSVVVVTALTIIGFGALLFGLLRMLVVRPLKALDAAAKQIAHGHLDVVIDAAGNDEIGRLGRTFSLMAGNLAKSQEQTRFLAYHDGLTGLPNRNMFKEYLAKALAHARRHGEQVALLFLDMDEFKQVNDTLGHQAGDTLLTLFADTLSELLRESDVVGRGSDVADDLVARLGGDEFIVLLPDVKGPEEAAAVAQRILDAVAQPFRVKDHSFYIGASIGVTLYPQDGDSVDELVKHADLAMYEAKRRGKNNFQFYRAEMNELAVARVRLEQRLRNAVEHRSFVLHYQPIVRAGSGECVGVEALVRWQDAETGRLVPPGEFIPVAEETGLIVPISQWVLEQACRQVVAWQQAGLSSLKLAVNTSSLELGGGTIYDTVRRVLDVTGMDPALLQLEMTETSIMSTGEDASANLARLKSLGISIALDDFGTGYSSLNYIREFAIDRLKIDRSFVGACTGSHSQRSIVVAIIAMAKALGLEVVGEGVETEGEKEFLRAQGCDLMQGFLFSRPLPAAELEAFVRGRRSA